MKYSRISKEEAERLARRDRNRLVGMTVLAVLLGAAYLFTQVNSDKKADAARAEQKAQIAKQRAETAVADIYVPEFESPEILEAIQDETDADKETLHSAPLEAVFSYARQVGDQSMMEALGRREMDASVQAELEGNSSEMRLDPVRARGRVVSVQRRERDGALGEEWVGTLQSLDGRYMHFLCARAPLQANQIRGVALGDYLRLDGLFHSLHSRPVKSDAGVTSIVAPLIIGRDLHASSPPITPEIAKLTPALDDVRDDEVEGITYDPDEFQEARWQLMAKAQMSTDDIDWEAAPELDDELLLKLYESGETMRGIPVRVPVSVNLSTMTAKAADNPLRLPRVTEGWIGNTTWKGPVKVIRWYGPFVRQDMMREQEVIDENRYVTARGFFFRNQVYTASDMQSKRAPVFIMAEADVFVPEQNKSMQIVAYSILGGTIILLGIIYAMLMSDKRKSRALYEEMLRRKRARRDREESSDEDGHGTSGNTPTTA